MGEDGLGGEPWYAVRCVFQTHGLVRLGQDELAEGQGVYEERITLWRASTFEEAVARAETEAAEYASTLTEASSDGSTTEYVGFAQAFHLFEDPDEGSEIFSLTRVSDLSTDDYVDHFFDSGRECQKQMPIED